MEGFYGVEVHAAKPTKAKIPADCVLCITQVALPANVSGPVTLKVQMNGSTFVLATLDAKKALYHLSTDMLFSATQDVSFIVEGTGSVHATGYVRAVDDDGADFDSADEFDDFDDDEENQEEDEELTAPVQPQKKRPKKTK